MDEVWIEYIPWVYGSIQLTVTIAISVIGVKYVRNEIRLQKNTKSTMKQQTELQITTKSNTNQDEDNPIEDEHKYQEQLSNESEKIKMMNKMGFCKLWFKIMWKMKGVYGGLAVHVFDVLTDILVIFSWFYYPDIDGDGIDPKVMAYCGIIALLFHKFISIIAFWAKERSLWRCLLQFLDLLIFEEIYASHKRIVSQIKFKYKQNSYNKDDTGVEDVDTTATFKFVRNLEAVFESMPQSILQLVFIIRTGWKSEGSGVFLAISILSIIQSIISMTNSILKNDNVYMTLPKWKKHKRRFPPTLPFIKHATARLSEVIYRICLCTLFWTICGGLAFGILIGAECMILLILIMGWDIIDSNTALSIEDLFLRVQSLIVMPSELVYAVDADAFSMFIETNALGYIAACLFGICCGPCSCFTGIAIVLSTLCYRDNYYIHMTLRIGVSMTEWILIIIWPFFINQDRYYLLFSVDYGLIVFVISIICFLIYTQYLYLFPNFSLPHNIPIRSLHGYAFNGELEDLQRLRLTQNKKANIASFTWNDDDPAKSTLSDAFWKENYNGEKVLKKDKDSIMFRNAFYGDMKLLKSSHEMKNHYGDAFRPSEYEWNDKSYDPKRNGCMTGAMLALSNKQYHVVEWLEKEKGLKRHREIFESQYHFDTMDHLFARRCLQSSLWPDTKIWDKPYEDFANPKQTTVTPLMLASSNKHYHVVDWLVKEKGAKLPTILFQRQKEFATMDYEFARKYIGNDYWK